MRSDEGLVYYVMDASRSGLRVAWMATLPNPIAFLAENPEMWTLAGGWQGFTGWDPGHKPLGLRPPPVPRAMLDEPAIIDF